MAEHHGDSGTRIYHIWADMKQRCYNPNSAAYHNYGARGITICDEWKENYTAFREWALSHGYQDDLTIDRIDNDGNYEPDNCRWATWTEQSHNKRPPTVDPDRCDEFEVGGENKPVQEWADEIGITVVALRQRWKRGDRGEDLIRKPHKKEPLPVRYDGKGERQKPSPESLKMPVRRIKPKDENGEPK